MKELAQRRAIPGWVMIVIGLAGDIWWLFGAGSTSQSVIEWFGFVRSLGPPRTPSWVAPTGLMFLGLVWLTILVLRPKSMSLDGRQKGEALDAEVYRLTLGPRAQKMVAELTRDLCRVSSRLDDFGLDVNVLVEMYIVNQSNDRHFIREIEGSVEIDGERHPLSRQSDFYAYESNHRRYEYCLTKGENDYDRSRLESLIPLFSGRQIILDARQPREGWVRFTIENIDPQKLVKNHTWKFSIIDSLGNEIPICKTNTGKREGGVTVREIER